MNEWKKLLLVPRIEFFMNEEAAREKKLELKEPPLHDLTVKLQLRVAFLNGLLSIHSIIIISMYVF